LFLDERVDATVILVASIGIEANTAAVGYRTTAAVRPLGVVESEVLPDPNPGVQSILVCLQIHLLVFHCAPQPLNEDVVPIPPLFVHADLDSMLLEHLGEDFAGKLASLVRLKMSARPPLSASWWAETLLQGLQELVDVVDARVKLDMIETLVSNVIIKPSEGSPSKMDVTYFFETPSVI
jgi:hypothetical protein